MQVVRDSDCMQSPPTEKTLVLREGDDVAVALCDLRAGDVLAGEDFEFRLQGDVPAGHKVALRAMAEGDPVRKYGQVIGFATRAITPGEHVHSHNLAVGGLRLDYEYGTEVRPVAAVPEAERRT